MSPGYSVLVLAAVQTLKRENRFISARGREGTSCLGHARRIATHKKTRVKSETWSEKCRPGDIEDQGASSN